MKHENPIRSLLGLAQEDLAMLLGVSRGRWSMYELGKRDIPLQAKQLLGEMLQHVNQQHTLAKKTKPELPLSLQPKLEQLLRENEFQQVVLRRKMADAIKKQEEHARLQHLVPFLQTRYTSKHDTNSLQQHLTNRASSGKETALSENVFQLQHRQEILVFEKEVLEAKLQKMRG